MVVVPYDDRWPRAFEEERDALLALLGSAAVAVHHVGSTAVPGLSAKPVIDVALEVPSLATIDDASPALVDRGYDARGEYGIPGRRYFSRPAGPGPKMHLHAFEVSDDRVARHLLFRDYLIAHPDQARQYGDLKHDLAGRHADDRDAYQAAKADFIGALHERASEWDRDRR